MSLAQDTVEVMIASHQAEIIKLQELKSNIALEIQESYDKGYTDGRAETGTDVIYTQAEVDNAIAAAIAPLNTQIADQQSQIGDIPNQVAAAVSAKVSEIKAKLQSAQAEESAIEQAFADELV